MSVLAERAAKLLRTHVSRPVQVDAVQITEENAAAVAAMVSGRHYPPGTHAVTSRIYFHCCNTRAKAGAGDWIIRTRTGFSVLTDEAFTEKYEGHHD